ncbi:MAG: response regulator transcription factor [Clostridia bacterium]
MPEQLIYLVEDDSSIRELVVYTLNNSGFNAQGFPSSVEFWKQIKTIKPDLVLLDIMLPVEDGMRILTKLKENFEYENIPVIMLTAKNTEFDRVVGLDKGADDYIAKPFGMMELISRIRAVLRRTGNNTKVKELIVGELTLNIERHIVLIKGQEVNLTFKEFELLKLLLENKGIVLKRDRILESIWGYDFDGETRTVDVHIRTLRSKLGTSGDIIETVRGIGYKISKA